MTTPATRLLNLIQLMQRRPGQKAGALAGALGVSVRTLHRYLGMLDEMGIPVYAERGPNGGFSLVRGYKLPPLIFSPDEAVAVCLGAGLVEATWGELYREAARGALVKLDNVLPEEQRREVAWAQRSLAATGLHRADVAALTPTLVRLRQAIREQRSAAMRYQGSGPEGPSERSFDAYALVHRSGWWYAVGFCHLRQGLRTFRVDRILALNLLDARFEIPADFDLQVYLSRERAMPSGVQVRMRFLPEAAQAAASNQSYWDALETRPDGGVEVLFTAPHLEWAASTVLAYGPIVEVLDPPELKALVQEWAEAVREKYADRGDK